MAISSVHGAAEPWPQKLAHKQGLRLCRGEVVAIKNELYAIVGFDGRNESYTCWVSTDQGVSFDTSRFVPLGRVTAHNAPRDHLARNQVPPLSPLDHLGRPVLAPVAEEDGRPASARGRRPGSRSGSGAIPALPPQVRPLTLAGLPQDSSGTKTSTSSSPTCPTPSVPGSVAGKDDRGWRSHLDVEALSLSPSLLTPATPASHAIVKKSCVVCDVLRIVASALSLSLWHLGASLARISARQRDSLQAQGLGAGSAADGEGGQRFPKASDAEAFPQTPTPDGIRDLNITIPIAKPSCWGQVQSLMNRDAVSFDERGFKEGMSIKRERWCAFVDRQKKKLEKEIRDLHDGKRPFEKSDSKDSKAFSRSTSASAEGGPNSRDVASSSSDGGEGQVSEAAVEQVDVEQRGAEDISELLQMVDGMEDWKDLDRYCGQSMCMASTPQGNEMYVNVVAFTTRDDGGVDYMRIKYKKSLEVHQSCLKGQTRAISGLHPAMQALLQLRGSDAGEDATKLAELMQRPDVAKYAIARAFQPAMAKDGVHLTFCESPRDKH